MSNPAISPTAPQWSDAASGLLTLTVAPFSVGDVLVAAFWANGGPATAVSGGGVRTWACASSYFDTTGSAYAGIWWGQVTATGTATVTVTDTGLGASYGKIWVREFTAPGAHWTAAAQNPAPFTTGGTPATSGTTVNYPSLSPGAGGNGLYVGAAWSYFGDITAGTSPGFFWANPGADGPEMMAYSPSASGPTAPSATSNNSGTWLAVAAMFTAGAGTVTAPAYATSAAVLGGGTGTWANPGNATGPPDGSSATWTAP